jgi:LmbE family N-acetylglucosaminyl deacetylase
VILQSIEQIDRHHRQIYLSPHYDDAVFSCGGSMALQRMAGHKALVITVFGGAGNGPLSSFATQVQRETGFGASAQEAVQRRQEEDAAATEALGADALWLDFPDAIYRGYDSREALFGSVRPADAGIEDQLAAILLEIRSRSPQAVIYAPLGVGHHVDHQIVCSAADRLTQQKANIKFYEDFPYVTAPGALQARQAELGLKMEEEINEVGLQLPMRIEAIALYRSQVPQLFGSEEQMRQKVESYASSIRTRYPGIRIERFWTW